MKNDFTKTMRNVSLKDDKPATRIGRNITVGVTIEPTEKLRLKNFMVQELNYYNALVAGFTSRARTFPETLLALHDDWIKVFAQLAYTGASIKELQRAKPDHELSAALEPHRKFLVGLDSQGRRFLTDTMYSIMELATTKAVLHPMVRRNMAVTILRHFKEQASKATTKGTGDDVYRSAPEMLPVRDIAEKRHLQIPRASLNSMKWNEDEECTEIFHCYSERPLKVPNLDLTQDNHWNLLILHQETDVHVVPSSHWFVDVKKVEQSYLIKYLDNANPRTGQAFAIAKRRSF